MRCLIYVRHTKQSEEIMATKKTVTVRHTCDICNKEANPINGISVRLRFVGEGGADVAITFAANVFYAATNGDVCKECAIQAMEKAIKRLKNDA